MTARTESTPDATTAVAQVIRYLETGVAAEGLFTEDVAAELAVRDAVSGGIRVARVDPTDLGFTMEFERLSESDDRHLLDREMLRADVVGSTVVDLALYVGGIRVRRA